MTFESKKRLLPRVLSFLGLTSVLAALVVNDFRLDRRSYSLEPPQKEYRITSEKGRVQTIRIPLVNSGRKEIRIHRASASCGCTVIGKTESQPIQPGEVGHLELSVNIPRAGTKKSKVVVYTHPASKPIEVSLSLVGIESPYPGITWFPKPIHIETHEAQSASEKELVIEVYEKLNESKFILGADSDDSAMFIELTDVVEQEVPATPDIVRRKYTFQMVVTGPDQPKETKANFVEFLTDSKFSKENPTLPVQVTFHSNFNVFPESVLVPLIDGSTKLKKQIIHIEPNTDLLLSEIDEVKAGNGVTVKNVESAPEKCLIEVSIQPPEGMEGKMMESKIQVDFADSKSLEIPVYFVSTN